MIAHYEDLRPAPTASQLREASAALVDLVAGSRPGCVVLATRSLAECYALVTDTPATADDLAPALGVEPQQARRTLRRLRSMGLVEPVPGSGRPKRWRGFVPPSGAVFIGREEEDQA